MTWGAESVLGCLMERFSNLNGRCEYGPFGELLRATGPMAKANPFRFSTKYQDDETDLLYYGYRHYNANTGKWLSRDPAGELSPYLYANNNPVSTYDFLGLWDRDVHFIRTTRWASDVHMYSSAAHMIGYYDDGADRDYSPFLFNEENWSWHFDRSHGGEDSRVVHARESLERAERACTWNGATRNDNWGWAALELGRALHPIQDWVAHGDFNRRTEAPNISHVYLPWDKMQYAHNYCSPFPGQNYRSVDDPTLDSLGPYGRPTLLSLVQ